MDTKDNHLLQVQVDMSSDSEKLFLEESQDDIQQNLSDNNVTYNKDNILSQSEQNGYEENILSKASNNLSDSSVNLENLNKSMKSPINIATNINESNASTINSDSSNEDHTSEIVNQTPEKENKFAKDVVFSPEKRDYNNGHKPSNTLNEPSITSDLEKDMNVVVSFETNINENILEPNKIHDTHINETNTDVQNVSVAENIEHRNDISASTDSTDLCPTTSTETFASSTSLTSTLSATSDPGCNNTSSNHMDINNQVTSCNSNRLPDVNLIMHDENEGVSNELSSRKRKLSNNLSAVDTITKIKKYPDDQFLDNSLIITNHVSGLDFTDTESCMSTDIENNTAESSTELEYNKTLISTELSKPNSINDGDKLLNTSDNDHISALNKGEESNIIGNPDANTSDSQNKSGTRDSIFLNYSGGINNELSSPDQVPMFELVSRLDEHNDIVNLTITRTDRKYLDYNADWSQNSSPSSVTSTGLYQLSEQKRYSTMSSSTTSSGYSTRTTDNFAIPAIPLKKSNIHKQGIKGHKELYRLVNEVFKIVFAGSDNNDMNLSNEKICIEDKDIDSKNVILNAVQDKKNENEQQGTNQILDSQYEIINSPEMITDDAMPEMNQVIRPVTPRTKQIRKTVRTRPASPRMKPAIVEEDFKSDPRIGNRVLARWIDKKYYAGRLLQVNDSNKFVIKFDDNHTKTLGEDYIVFGEHEALPLQGQSVYAILDNEQDYEPAIVTSIAMEKDGASYVIETDKGVTTAVPASDLFLTEDQAKAIKEIQVAEPDVVNTPRRGNVRDVNLDNIIQGPRSRRQVSSNKSLTPKPGSSGLNKKRYGPRSKARHVSESSDKSTTEPPSPGSVNDNSSEECSKKTPIEEVQGVEPEVQKTPKKIPGALTGPFPVKGCGRLSGRRTSKVVGSLYDNSDPETVELLGPIPESRFLFHSKHFLLTCTEDVPHRTKLIRMASYEASSGTDSEYSTDMENCNVPFVKERLKCQLEAGGGIVYSHFEEVPTNKYRHCILIAPRPCHTAKYIQCLASNIKAVKHTWVVDCCKSNRIISEYELPAGWSIERKCYVRYDIGKELYMRLSHNPFHNFLIMLCSDNINFLEFWGRVCKSAGASIKTIDTEDMDISVGSVLVTDSDCPLKVRKQAQTLDIPLVSTTWVVQSLIVGQVCHYDNNIKYAHNYVDTD